MLQNAQVDVNQPFKCKQRAHWLRMQHEPCAKSFNAVNIISYVNIHQPAPSRVS